jgi:hypothetical protein
MLNAVRQRLEGMQLWLPALLLLLSPCCLKLNGWLPFSQYVTYAALCTPASPLFAAPHLHDGLSLECSRTTAAGEAGTSFLQRPN